MKKKLFFLIAILLVGAVTGVSFAAQSTTAGVSISQGGVGGVVAEVKTNPAAIAAGIQLKYSGGTTITPTQTDPAWSPIESAVGSITAGDVYYIDASTTSGDLLVTLYLANPGPLASSYTYLNLKINIWKGGEGAWTQASRATPLGGSTAIGAVYLTLTNGFVSFILAGSEQYDISVESGSWYNISTSGTLSPDFFLDVRLA